MHITLKRKILTVINKFQPTLAAAVLASALPSLSHGATVVDLSLNDSGTINGGVYVFNDANAGTGLFNAMVRIGANKDVIKGYNTDGRPLPFDEDAPQTKGVRLTQVPLVSFGGVQFFQFDLDINEPNNDNRFLSLDTIKIFTAAGNCDAVTLMVNTLGTLRYDMDAGDSGNKVLLDGNRTPGSGKSDMVLYVPVSNFIGASGTDCIYLYSEFGGDLGAYKNDSGFEEWSVRGDGPFVGGGVITAIPEPASALLLVLGAASGLVSRRRHRPTGAGIMS